MRYRLALANSLNIAAVKVLASVGGPAALQRRLRAFGYTPEFTVGVWLVNFDGTPMDRVSELTVRQPSTGESVSTWIVVKSM